MRVTSSASSDFFAVRAAYVRTQLGRRERIGRGPAIGGLRAAPVADPARPRRPHATLPALTPEDHSAIADEFDALRTRVIADRGARDAAYIRRVIKAQRLLELGGRAALVLSRFRPAWLVGTAAVTVAKILENMEIGHNVLHGQWDWMRDPNIHSTTWEWDWTSPAALWKESHNGRHHVYTNVLGLDHDLGYGLLRMNPEQEWRPFCLGQPVYCAVLSLGFEYFLAAYDLEIGKYKSGEKPAEKYLAERTAILTKARRQLAKDFVYSPLLSGRRGARRTMLSGLIANLVRNVWAQNVIFCGHFPVPVQTFPEEYLENETRGQWYVRQLAGSGNIDGGPLLHLLTGNLSHQIEHHLFPDLPSNRYAEIAPEVRKICERYGLPYVSGPLHRQVGSAWATVFRLAVPNDAKARLRAALRQRK